MNSQQHTKGYLGVNYDRTLPRDSLPTTLPSTSPKGLSSRSTDYEVMGSTPLKRGSIVGPLVFVMALASAFSYMVHQAMALPTVTYSNSLQRCVQVTYADGTMGSCSQLPERYSRIIVH